MHFIQYLNKYCIIKFKYNKLINDTDKNNNRQNKSINIFTDISLPISTLGCFYIYIIYSIYKQLFATWGTEYCTSLSAMKCRQKLALPESKCHGATINWTRSTPGSSYYMESDGTGHGV